MRQRFPVGQPIALADVSGGVGAIVRDGAVIDANSPDAGTQGVRRFNAALNAEPCVTATVLQTVGSKVYDGLAIAVVTADQPA